MTRLNRRDLGLLALRAGIGTVLAAHGSQKLFGWFGGGGISRTAEGMRAMGFTPGKPSAVAASLCEAGGGLLLALGLATPVAGAVAAGGMAGAASVHVSNGFFAQKGGLEYPGLIGWTAASLGIMGPGHYSLDHATGHRLDRSWMVPVALAAGALGTTLILRKRLKENAEDED
ncbi:DoxX family protein [Streptomyces sp. NPDC088725]|uniref:DoxX family protein n=1 Tax=Streptomyces sp. NPDC088725 TaxID=3365873 RepID=UPI0037F9279C